MADFVGEQSRNSWINKDEPADVSSMGKFKDDYEDILNERRNSSDLKYVLRHRQDVPRYKYSKPRTPGQVKEHVLQSDRVKYTAEQISRETGTKLKEVMQEASEMLDEMAHNLSMGAIRSFAYALIKVFKSLFNRVYVNEEGMQRLRELIKEYPVILMPSHRSYLDFLLVSYIMFEYDLPLPVIAAAMDFSGMKFVGWLLRNSGAFYIRRSFGTDKLYWAVFTEYVQTQLRNGDAPMEFFVEGTRSRTSKAYIPRIGMLAASLESYFKAEVPDVMIIPISISYERILEESLYAYELLGIPKPKESTGALIKARTILSEDYGSVHFFMGEAISIRQFSTGKIDRTYHALEPRYINSLTDSEQDLAKELAFNIVRRQQKHMVVSPWALSAAVLMQNREGIPVKQLVKDVEWLKRQAANFGAYVDWPGNASADSVVRHYLELHKNVAVVSDSDFVELTTIKPAAAQRAGARNAMLLNAATSLVVASYRNQLLHVFIRPAIIALCVNSSCQEVLPLQDLYTHYTFLEKVFSKDFVFEPEHTKSDFHKALLTLQHSGGVTLDDQSNVMIKKSMTKATTFLSQMFEPFLLGYWVLGQHLLSLPHDVHGRPLPKKPKNIAKDAQTLATRLLQENIIKHHEILSLDILSNGLNMLVDFGTMHKDKRNEDTYLSPNHVAVNQFVEKLSRYIEIPQAQISQYAVAAKVLVSAKL